MDGNHSPVEVIALTSPLVHTTQLPTSLIVT
jgi:hypothetical protein